MGAQHPFPRKPFGVSLASAMQGCSILPSLVGAVGPVPLSPGGEKAAEVMGPLGSLKLRQTLILCRFPSDSPIFLHNMEP